MAAGLHGAATARARQGLRRVRSHPPGRGGNGAAGGGLDRERVLPLGTATAIEVTRHHSPMEASAPLEGALRLSPLPQVPFEKLSAHGAKSAAIREHCQVAAVDRQASSIRYGPRVPAKTEEDRQLAARICGWIRREMTLRGISQNELARRMGLKSSTLSRYMAGERIPPCGFVLKAARVLKEVTTSQLVHEDPEGRFMQEPGAKVPSQAASVTPGARKRSAGSGGGPREA
jgi:ribosome-binding protein aMBF1 (putative translation factor)